MPIAAAAILLKSPLQTESSKLAPFQTAAFTSPFYISTTLPVCSYFKSPFDHYKTTSVFVTAQPSSVFLCCYKHFPCFLLLPFATILSLLYYVLRQQRAFVAIMAVNVSFSLTARSSSFRISISFIFHHNLLNRSFPPPFTLSISHLIPLVFLSTHSNPLLLLIIFFLHNRTRTIIDTIPMETRYSSPFNWIPHQ